MGHGHRFEMNGPWSLQLETLRIYVCKACTTDVNSSHCPGNTYTSTNINTIADSLRAVTNPCGKVLWQSNVGSGPDLDISRPSSLEGLVCPRSGTGSVLPQLQFYRKIIRFVAFPPDVPIFLSNLPTFPDSDRKPIFLYFCIVFLNFKTIF